MKDGVGNEVINCISCGDFIVIEDYGNQEIFCECGKRYYLNRREMKYHPG